MMSIDKLGVIQAEEGGTGKHAGNEMAALEQAGVGYHRGA